MNSIASSTQVLLPLFDGAHAQPISTHDRAGAQTGFYLLNLHRPGNALAFNAAVDDTFKAHPEETLVALGCLQHEAHTMWDTNKRFVSNPPDLSSWTGTQLAQLAKLQVDRAGTIGGRDALEVMATHVTPNKHAEFMEELGRLPADISIDDPRLHLAARAINQEWHHEPQGIVQAQATLKQLTHVNLPAFVELVGELGTAKERHPSIQGTAASAYKQQHPELSERLDQAIVEEGKSHARDW